MHRAFRSGRLLAVAFATYFAVGCGSTMTDQAPPHSDGAAVEAPSMTRLAEVQIHVGRAALAQGNLNTALELFEKAHNTSPQDARPLVGKGDVLFARRQFGEAEAAYRAALLRDSNLYEAREGLGKALVSTVRYQEGLREFEAAAAIRTDASLLNKMGVTHEMLGHGEIAQKYYRDALALQADSLTARNNLALSLGVSGSYDAALKEMKKVVASPGASERHHANLAFIYGLSGRSMDSVPPRVARAATSKGWDDAFFARTREIAKAGDRTAILDLLNNRRPPAATAPMPAMAALPEMPDSEPQAADEPVAAPPASGEPANVPPPAGAGQGASQPTVLVPPPPPAPAPAMAESPAEPPPAMAEPLTEPAMAEARPEPAPELATEPATEQISASVSEPATEQPLDRPEASPELATQTPSQASVAALPMSAPAPGAAPLAAAPDGAFRVQLGAFKSVRWLSATLARLKTAAHDLLPENRVNVAYEKDLYLVRSYGLPSRAAAKELCEELRGRGFECFVTRMGAHQSGQAFDLASAEEGDAIARFIAALPEIKVARAMPGQTASTGSEDRNATQSAVGDVSPPASAPKEIIATLQPAGPAAVNSPDVPAVPAAEGTKPDTGEYRVQLAAYRLARHVARGIAVLRRAAGELLPPLEGLVRASAGNTHVPFRLRSAPLESREAARDLCRKLAEKGLGCLVIRHGAQYWRPLA